MRSTRARGARPLRGPSPKYPVGVRLLLALLTLLGIGCANRAPVLTLSTEAIQLAGGVPRTIPFTVEDPDGDEVTVTVTAQRGTASIEGLAIVYVAPDEPGDDAVALEATDGDLATSATLAVTVEPALGWSLPEQVASTPGNSKSPSIAVTADGTVHVVWHDFTDDPPTLRHAAHDGVAWTESTLDLGPDKVLRGKLVADGSRLHLVYDRFIDGEYDVWHSALDDGVWSPSTLVGVGRKPSPALLDGTLHVAWYGVDDQPAHAWLDGDSWVDGDLLIDAPYINPIRLQLLGVDGGVELGILLSPGDTSYDMNVLRWTADGGWGEPVILYVSNFLGAEEPTGAVDPSGAARWAWAEQHPVDLWTYDIVTAGSTPSTPDPASALDGFNAMPAIAAPAPDGAQVAWISDGYDLYVSREPFDGEPLLVRELSRDPALAVDADGWLHMAWIGDVDGVEQVLYATTRP